MTDGRRYRYLTIRLIWYILAYEVSIDGFSWSEMPRISWELNDGSI
jgi:hypothetical protein